MSALKGRVHLQNAHKFFVENSIKSYLLHEIFRCFGLTQIVTSVDFANPTSFLQIDNFLPS